MSREKHLTRKEHLAGTWMSEKSFAATPYSCHDKMLDLHIIMQRSVDILSWHPNNILSELKDFEDIHVPEYKDQLHLLG